jgi:succinate-semialdehyde dehydrogenase / glutarate-semialdehyde dehydrogenase
VDDAVANGATLLAGGDRPEGLTTGHFFAPTVLADVTDDMEIFRSEIFGPVVSLISFTDHDTLLDRANAGDAGGLNSYIFTSDLARAERFAAGLDVGEVQINGVKYDIDLPHGGVGQSGIGHDCSPLALHEYFSLKRVSRALVV